MNLLELVKKIKEKKELSGVPRKIILKELELYLKKENISLTNLRGKDAKIVVSAIRAILRRMTGQFALSDKNELKHKSSKEREKIYPSLKKLISELNTKSILDLGCGLNPLYLATKGIIYYAYDVNEYDLGKIKEYFVKNTISGKVKIYDLRDDKEVFPETDLCLILKVFDVIENRGHKLAENIINRINSKYILISFSTRTLSGKAMNHPQRGWIERLLFRFGFSYVSFKGKNEVFYLASRHQSQQLMLSLQSIQEMQL